MIEPDALALLKTFKENAEEKGKTELDTTQATEAE